MRVLAAYVPGASVNGLVPVFLLVVAGLVIWGILALFDWLIKRDAEKWQEQSDADWAAFWAEQKARSDAFWEEENRKSREWFERMKR